MKVITKNVVALIVGILIGSIVNMALIIVSSPVIPPPEGVDVKNAESLRSSIHLFEPRHFVFPFLAHALGALIGSFIAALMAATHRSKLALAVGVFFFALRNCECVHDPRSDLVCCTGSRRCLSTDGVFWINVREWFAKRFFQCCLKLATLRLTSRWSGPLSSHSVSSRCPLISSVRCRYDYSTAIDERRKNTFFKVHFRADLRSW